MKSKPLIPAAPLVHAPPEGPDRLVLRLYVAGQSPKSAAAIANTRKICEEYLQGAYVLDVIDLYQQPQLAQEEQIIALPALIRKHPSPTLRIIGDMSDALRVLQGLDLQPGA